MLRTTFLSLLAWLALSPAMAAPTNTVELNASGYGDTPTQATARALVEVSRQALGASVVLDPGFRTAIQEWVVSQTENGNLIQGSWSSEPEAQLPVMANLKSYRVLDTSKVEDGLWRSRVEARVLRYEGFTADRQHLPTLVVTPFRTARTQFDLGTEQPATRVRHRFQQYLANALQKSGKLRLLDRNFSDAAARENQIAASSLSVEEQVKRGQQLGADLLLAGEIEDFSLGRNSQSFYGATFNTLEPHVVIHYRLIDTATREILRAESFQYRKLPARLREAFDNEDIDPEREPERIGEVLYPRVATELADSVLETLYPIRVLSVTEDGSVFISAGLGRVREGDLFSAHGVARKSEDPDTGLPLRMHTPALATLRVTAVHEGYSVAETLGAPVSQLNAETLLQRQARPEEEQKGPDRPTTPGSSEKPIDWGQ